MGTRSDASSTAHAERQHFARIRAGLTLAELIISISIMSVLLGGIGSAMLLAGKTMPSGNAALIADAEASRALMQIASELSFATSVSSVSSTAIEFTVPDRNHGAAGPETIRYEWSGSAGDPLVRRYNGGSPGTLVSRANSVTISPDLAAGEIPQTLRVLLVVPDATTLSAGDSERKSLLESWGMTGAVIDDDATPAAFVAAARDCDVIYISHAINSTSFRNKALNVRRGVVVESFSTIADYKLGTGPAISLTTAMNIANSNHPITLGLSGSVSLVTLTSTLSELAAPAANATVLGSASGGNALLVVADVNTRLNDGVVAAGRRVKFPGGVLLYSMSALTTSGKKVLARSLGWAGAPISIRAVRVRIQTSQGTTHEAAATLLSQPAAPPN